LVNNGTFGFGNGTCAKATDAKHAASAANTVDKIERKFHPQAAADLRRLFDLIDLVEPHLAAGKSSAAIFSNFSVHPTGSASHAATASRAFSTLAFAELPLAHQTPKVHVLVPGLAQSIRAVSGFLCDAVWKNGKSGK